MRMLFKQFSFTFSCFIFLYAAIAQPIGKVIEQKSVKSSIMGKDVMYSIYLPYDYAQSERSYPVVYLLHGYTDDNTAWLQYGEVNRYADKAITDGTIPPMIIVMPDADSTFYINSYDGKEKYEDFLLRNSCRKLKKRGELSPKKDTGVLPVFPWAVKAR